MKKHRVMDLFCGCGGISEGFRLAGMEIVAGLDHDHDAATTFRRNFPSALVESSDLLLFDEKMIQAKFAHLGISVIVGGPPCQGFSNANRWQKESEDPRNKLFYEYLKFVKVLSPEFVLIENVRGILTRDGGYAKKRIESLLVDLGYQVSSALLNAADYGVPQYRQRAFFVGVKSQRHNKFEFESLEKQKKVTVKNAIGELYKFPENTDEVLKLKSKPKTEYQKYLRRSDNLLYNNQVVFPAKTTQEKISYVPQGGNWQDIPVEKFPTNRNNRHSSAFKRLKEDDCSVTIDTGNAHSNYFHPIHNRIPTVREAARLQSFSDNFVFMGGRSSQYRQVGNAVPPLLARAIAEQFIGAAG